MNQWKLWRAFYSMHIFHVYFLCILCIIMFLAALKVSVLYMKPMYEGNLYHYHCYGCHN